MLERRRKTAACSLLCEAAETLAIQVTILLNFWEARQGEHIQAIHGSFGKKELQTMVFA
jgi:hypothetical protein